MSIANDLGRRKLAGTALSIPALGVGFLLEQERRIARLSKKRNQHVGTIHFGEERLEIEAIMKATVAASFQTPAAPNPHFLEPFARRAVRSRLVGLEHGVLTLIDGDSVTSYGKRTPRCGLSATLRVNNPRFYSEIAFGGSIGAGEAYMQGYWTADDLTAVVRILLQNRGVVDGLEGGVVRATALLQKALLHCAARNTRRRSRRNISAHYDLGNDFFRLFLDPTLMYSSAVFERADQTLEEASLAKLDRICQKLDLGPGDRVLEIGTGWAGFALHASRYYGCHVTTTTISHQQYAWAWERIDAEGLGDRISLLLEDYRDLTGSYDKLVSIEMIESVGHHYYDAYFRKCGDLLKPDGMMLLQAIIIADQRHEAARKSVDFIQRYIFPGGCIPSVTVMNDAIGRVTDMRLYDLEDIGLHYAKTLRRWRENLFANLDQVRALGYPEEFIRMWEFYFCYCEGGVAECAIGDVQMLLIKPLARPIPIELQH